MECMEFEDAFKKKNMTLSVHRGRAVLITTGAKSLDSVSFMDSVMI